jgi:UDP-N-acetyl-D-glucosamine dehydrogenase
MDIIEELQHWNATVTYHDPLVPTFSVGSETFESVPLTPQRVEAADCVVLLTDHSALDIELLAAKASFLFDTRNATAGYDQPNIVRL